MKVKKILSVGFIMLLLLTVTACQNNRSVSSEKSQQNNVNVADIENALIIYYSYSGTTERVAERLQEITKGDIYEIQPEIAYSDDSNEATVRLMEERDTDNLPSLAGELPDLSQYDVIFIGTPVWNDSIANPVMSYLEQTDFDGKVVMPFWTYITSQGTTENDFYSLNENSEMKSGLAIRSANGYSDDELSDILIEWING